MIIMMISISSFLILGIILVIQLLKLLKRDYSRISKIVSIVIGSLVLLTTYIYPYGLIDFTHFEPETKLEASRVGGGNCNQKLKLYVDQTFIERERCFSTSTTKGNWKLLNDTIFFSNVIKGASIDEYYSIAIIKQSNLIGSMKSLQRFRSKNDTIGHEIFIFKNEIIE